MTIVVDASVAAKWVVPEHDSLAAQALLDRRRGTLHGPDLLLIEVAGVVVRRANQRLVGPELAIDALRGWTALFGRGDVTAHRSSPDLLREAARLAIALGHPLKDCVYLALAIELDCPLLTADARFRDRTAAEHPRVRLLGEAAPHRG